MCLHSQRVLTTYVVEVVAIDLQMYRAKMRDRAHRPIEPRLPKSTIQRSLPHAAALENSSVSHNHANSLSPRNIPLSSVQSSTRSGDGLERKASTTKPRSGRPYTRDFEASPAWQDAHGQPHLARPAFPPCSGIQQADERSSSTTRILCCASLVGTVDGGWHAHGLSVTRCALAVGLLLYDNRVGYLHP